MDWAWIALPSLRGFKQGLWVLDRQPGPSTQQHDTILTLRRLCTATQHWNMLTIQKHNTTTRPCILLQMISCHLKDNKQPAIDRWRRHVIFGTLLLNIKENQWRLGRGMERKEWSSVSGLFELIFLSLWLPTSRSPQPPPRLLHSPLTAGLTAWHIDSSRWMTTDLYKFQAL